MTSLYSLLIVAIVAISVNQCSAFTDEQREKFITRVKANLADCGPKYSVALEQLIQWKLQKKVPDNVDKCFFACMMKKSGLLDDKGMFSEAVALEKVKEYASADKLAAATEAVKTCSKVNEEAVTDGDAGCQRAALITKCVREQKELLGIPA